MNVLPTATVIFVLAGNAVWSQGAGLAAPAEEAAKVDLLKRTAAIKASLAEGKPPDESAVMQMLIAAHKLPANDRAHKQYVQLLFSQVIWDPALSQSVADLSHPQQSEAHLAGTIEHWNTILQNAKLSCEVVSIGKLHLSLFQFRAGRIAALRGTLDQLADTIIGPEVWPGFQAMFWNLRGLAETEVSNYALAMEYHLQALSIRHQAKLHEDEAESLNNLGLISLRLGDYGAAKPQFEKAIEIYNQILQVLNAEKAKSPQDTQVQKRLAKVWESAAYAKLNLAKAIEGAREFNQSAAMLEDLNQPRPEWPMKNDLKCFCLNNLALVYFNQGHFQQCADVLQECRTIAAQAFEQAHLHLAEIDVNQAWAALSMGQVQQADSQFRAALDHLTTHFPHHPRRAEVMGYLARVCMQLGHEQEARDLLNNALDRRQKYLLEVLSSSLSDRDRLAFVQELRVHPESIAWPGVFDTFLELAPALKIPAEEQYRRLLGWKGVLTRDVSFWQEEPEPRERRTLAARFAEIRRTLRDTHRDANQADSDLDTAQIQALEIEANEVKRQLSQLNVRQDPRTSSVEPRDVIAALPPKSALLDIIEVRRYLPRNLDETVKDDRIYIGFLIAPDKSVKRIEFAASAKSVDASIQSLVDRLAGERPFSVQAQRVDSEWGRALKDQLPPVELLIVAADGAFHRLPIAVLPGKDAETYWIEQMAFLSVPSAQSLVAHWKLYHNKRQHKLSPTWLAIGGVDYGQAEQPKWPFLKASLREASAINQLFRERFSQSTSAKQATLITGKEATKELFCRLLPHRAFVHVATHGAFADKRTDAYAVFDESAQLDSVLVLAGANANQKHSFDSLLTAEEIAWMDLRNVDLLVLSACQTGLGHIRAGQGMIGLVSALDQAGVGTTVSSLWKVEDEATRSLMESFYRTFLQESTQLSPAAALRSAQLKMINQQRAEDRQHPYYWAGWLCTGAPGAMQVSP